MERQQEAESEENDSDEDEDSDSDEEETESVVENSDLSYIEISDDDASEDID